MNGPASPSKEEPKARVELLRRIEALHPVPKLDGAQFVAGARLRLRRGIDQDRALAIVAELQAAGANVEVEANRPPDEAILALDQFHDAEPEPDRDAALNEKMLAQLQSLDGDEPRLAVDRDAATRAELAPAKPMPPKPMPAKPMSPTSIPPTSMPPTPMSPTATPASEPVDDARFRPSGDWHKPMELELERAPLPPSPSPSPEEEAAAVEEPLPPSPIIDETWRPVPGRIAQGALRKNPPVRIAIGVVAALFVGWMFAQPYARHSERHVAELRAQADAERYRPVEEAQMRVRALDRQADDASSSGAFGMAAIWLLVGAGTFAGWWRAT